MSVDADIIAQVFTGEGASTLTWEVSTRCTCYSVDTKEPNWECTVCGGLGAAYAPPVEIRALFRSQSRWRSPQMVGELQLGEAALTTPLNVKPSYVDRRNRDRFTVVNATGDAAVGRVFYPTGEPVPFLIADEHLAWRCQVASLEQDQRVIPQP